MLEYLEELLSNKYQYELAQYKLIKAPVEKNKLLIPLSSVFGVIVILYILVLANVLPGFLNIFVVIAAFALLVLLPLKYGTKRSKEAALIITPKYLIQVVNKREFVIVEFNEISKYYETQQGEMIVYQGNKKVVIEKNAYKNKLTQLIDILEAKGKTFDKSKDYMIRPIEIVIEDGEITITDIEVVSTTDRIIEKYYKDYPMLTPGHVGGIIFRNSQVNEVIIDDNELILILDRFEVNPGHPENTTFESIIADECIVIFEDVQIKGVSKIDLHEKKPKIEKLVAELDSFVDEIEAGVISEWTIKKNLFHAKFAAGVYVYHVKIGNEEVLCGCKKTIK